MTVLGIAALGLLFAWLLGGFLLRLGGLLLVVAGLIGLAVSGNGDGILIFAIGALLWLGGQWHWALRHDAFKSSLARYVFCRWAPRWLDPTPDRAIPVAGSEAERRTR
jgi:hypothetical protein